MTPLWISTPIDLLVSRTCNALYPFFLRFCARRISGLGNSIHGTAIMDKPSKTTCKMDWPGNMRRFSGTLPGDMIMPIRIAFKSGGAQVGLDVHSALFQLNNHLNIMRNTKYPKSDSRKMICGTNSKKKLTGLRKKRAFSADMSRPKVICETPSTIESFILYELKNSRPVCEGFQIGSKPNGYGRSGGRTAAGFAQLSIPHAICDAAVYCHRVPNMSTGMAKISLYMNPVYMENRPMRKIIYRPLNSMLPISPKDLLPWSLLSMMIRASANKAIRMPCPISPNITANKNGKVITRKGAGFTSWYSATPYASTMLWNTSVNLLSWKYVGGVSCPYCRCSITDWICALLFSYPLRMACSIRGNAYLGHHPSATNKVPDASELSKFKVWKIAFLRSTSLIHASISLPISNKMELR
mmetsp:Transcript_13462/g.22965  ORF Transcript_13462/g.22965 Transcript_13462/m.22965 type:complete len:412 (+) Transcript_13462:1043-2278(+)